MDDLKTKYKCIYCDYETDKPIEYLKHLDREHDAVTGSWRKLTSDEDAKRHIGMLGL